VSVYHAAEAFDAALIGLSRMSRARRKAAKIASKAFPAAQKPWRDRHAMKKNRPEGKFFLA
jgi:hypothetical protein